MNEQMTISDRVDAREMVVAVAGNPNSGKSTLINELAGARLQVGNWPGVTVEKKEALLKLAGRKIHLVDLPGTYSLSPYSLEEQVARDFLLHEKPDLIINVVDATNLERNLYLTLQLLELEIPVVMALNMMDELGKAGQDIRVELLENLLGIPVLPTVAVKGIGLDRLKEWITQWNPEKKLSSRVKYSGEVEQAIQAVKSILGAVKESEKSISHSRFVCMKILEEGQIFIQRYWAGSMAGELEKVVEEYSRICDGDPEGRLADERYGVAAGIAREVVDRKSINRFDLTEKIDRIVLNRVLGIPIFLAAMGLVFKFTFDVSTPFVDWIDAMTAGPFHRWGAYLLGLIHAPEWLISLATDGVIAGVGFVLVFVPVIFAMMFFITFLEGTGYMARAAFVMDRVMHSLGLHGKSFIPLLMGFGCNVPAIYATRTLESRRDRILTSLLVPFMSCGARLPVYVLFISIFFPHHSGWILWGLYVFGILMAVLLGILLKNTLFRSDMPVFIMELPPYRLPSLKHLWIHTWEKGKHFLIKAGTYIMAVSIFVWFLLNLPWGVQDKKDSVLGKVAQATAPIFKPLGFGTWEASASLMTGIIAKEIVVGTMAEIYVHEMKEDTVAISFKDDIIYIITTFGESIKQAFINFFGTFGIASLSVEDDTSAGLKEVVRSGFTPLSALSFMIFVLLYMPCVVTGIAYKQEFGSFKWYLVAIGLGFVTAYSSSFLVYQIGQIFIR